MAKQMVLAMMHPIPSIKDDVKDMVFFVVEERRGKPVDSGSGVFPKRNF